MVPITLCRKGIDQNFKVIWTADSGKPFKAGGNCPTSTSCYTEVTILGESPPVATLVLSPATIDESGNANTSTITATLNKTAGDSVTLDVSASPVSPAVDGDFKLSQNTTLTIPAGSKTSTGTVTITAEDNSVDAPDKTITVSATASGANVKVPESKTLTIVDDDDAPTSITLTVDTASIAEGASATNITVTASVDGTTSYGAEKTVQVTVGGAGSTATSGTDFAQVGGFPITIPAGGTSDTGTFSLNPTDDSDHEGDETIIVAGTSSGITITHAILTITDNDGPPPAQPAASFGLATSSAAENAGTHNVTVNLSRAAPSGGLTLSYDVSGTATAGNGNDFTIQSSGTLSVAAGADSATIPVAITDDSIDDDAETVILTLTGGTGYTLGSPKAHTLTITDNDGPPPAQPAASFGLATSSAAENAGTHNVTVNLSRAAPSGGLTLSYDVSGTATAGNGNDFTIQSSGTLSVAAGADSATIPVAITDDSIDDDAETVILTLTGGTGYTLGSPKAHTLTITDNDGPPPAQPAASFGLATSSAAENAGTHNVTVNLSRAAPSGGLTLSYDVSGTATAGNGNDFTIQSSGTLSVAAGADSATIPVAITDDSIDDDAETVILTLTGGTGYTLGSPKAHTLTITDNDGPPPAQPAASFDSATSSAAENAGTHNVTVNLSRVAPSGGLALTYTVGGTATAGNGNDFTIQNSGTLSVAAGADSATIPVAITDDSIDDDAETIILTLTGGTGYTLGSPKAHTLTITDNDGPPPARSSHDGDRSFSINDATAMEKDGTINFTVRLSAATRGNSQASVRVATRDVTAVSGLDYRSLDNKLVVFQAGETEKVVKVELINDAHNEGAETFEVVLSNPVNAVIGDGVATGTINNADYVPQSELAHFGRSVANHVLEGVIDRISSPRSPGASARIAGNVVGKADRAPDPDCPGCGILSIDKRVEKFDREEILTDSSFVLNGQDDSSHSPAFWGRGTRSYFRDKPGNLSVDGEVTSFILGADLGWSDRKIIGLALIRSSGKIDHMEKPGVEDPNTGMTKLTLTALVPYAGWKINDSIDVWGALGHGNGKMELDLSAGDTSEMIKTSFDWTMAAAGLRGDVVRPGPDGGPRLTALLDGYRVRTSSKETEGLAASKASVTRLRAGLEASWEMQLEDGSILVPRVETNLIQETGDVGSGFGLELVGGLSWSDPDTGLAVDLSARRLRSHDSPGRKDHGYSMALVYDPNPESERGLSVSMRQDRGNSESTMNGLLTSGLPETAAEDSISSQWTTELAYGLPVIDGSFTGSPHAGIEETDDYRDYKVGWRLTPAGPQAPDLSFDINAARRERLLSNSSDHRLGVGLVAEW